MWAILMGLLLGSLSRYSSRLTPSLRWLGNVGAPWLLVAFFVGRVSRSIPMGAGAGAIALSAAAVTHYVPYRAARFGLDAELFRHPLFMWMLVGGAAGALFGGLGCIQRRGDRAETWGTAALMACLAGESVLLFLIAPRYAWIVSGPVQLVSAAALPFVLGTDRRKSYLVTAALLPLCVVGLWVMVEGLDRVYPGL
jgi:hypothetical protein